MVDPSKIRSWRVLAAAAALDMFCVLGLFRFLQDQMLAAARANGYKGTPKDLLVLDLRVGYTQAEMRQLLLHWGPQGCGFFVICEVIDYLVHIPCFGCVLLVFMNRLGPLAARKTALPALRKVYLWVLLALALDATENALQLLLVLAYLQQPQLASAGWWEAAAAAASVVNMAKWWTARCGGALSLLLAAAALSPSSVKPARKQQPKQKQG